MKRRIVRTQQIDLELTPQMHNYLVQLVSTGLYGRTVQECAEQLLREQLREVMVARHKAGLDAALGGVRTCRKCGCTDAMACPEGCFWVDEDLCSACVPTPATRKRK